MNLPGWLFMLLGGIVAAYAKFVESKGNTALGVFFWFGIMFVLYGFGKEMVKFLNRPKKKKEKVGPPHKESHPEKDHRHPGGNQFHGKSNHETHQHAKGATQHSHPHKPAHKPCPHCQNVNVNHARYCHTCAYQFY